MISKVMNVEIRKLLIAGQYRLKEFFFLHRGLLSRFLMSCVNFWEPSFFFLVLRGDRHSW